MQRRRTATEVWYLRAELEREVNSISTGAPSSGDRSPASAAAAASSGRLDPALAGDVRGLPFVVVGAGRLGVSLALALVDAGAVLRGHTGRSASGRARAAAHLGIPSLPTLADLVGIAFADLTPAGPDGPRPTPEPDEGPPLDERPPLDDDPLLFLLTVPDGELARTAAALAEAVAALAPAPSAPVDRPAWAVAHTSGVTPVSVLDPCAALGALTFSFHPLQTFSDPSRGPALLRGASVAVTPGPDTARRERAQRLGERLARAVGGRPFLLEERHRTLYHAAAVMASNYLVTVEHAAELLFLHAGLPADEVLSAFLPLARGALENIAAQGTTAALTGPLSRGDAGTVSAHLRALEQETPDLATLYRALGRATLGLVRDRDDLPADTIDALETIMNVTAERTPDSATGAFTVVTRTVSFSTKGEGDVIDLTDRIGHLLRETGLTAGTVTVFAPGATGSVTTLEFEPGVVHDFQQLFARIIPADDPYRHNLLLQDGNGHSHVRAGLLGPSLVIPFVNGRLTLGTWQEAVFVCFDHIPRDRKVIVQFMGVSEE